MNLRILYFILILFYFNESLRIIMSLSQKLKLAEQLYSNEKFLRSLKRLNENADSKSIVDRATKKPIDLILKNLESLDEFNLNEIQNFVDNFFHEPGIEITKSNLTDWQEYPVLLKKLKNEKLKEFFITINKIWLDLYKKFDESILEPGSVSSHLPMKHPFIVPGGRFIEMYYWDSYWTAKGLLVCGMFNTVRQMIENFIHFIKLFGFIPNGSRVYYLNRSQPPYFSQIIFKYYQYSQISDQLTNDEKLEIKNFVLNQALKYMIIEYEFWMSKKLVEIKDHDITYKLNVYKANTIKPRPESYFEDIKSSSCLKNETEKEKFYHDVASGAESGHDFTSRWCKDPFKLSTIETSDIIPVDLNAILYKTEVIIAKLSYIREDFETHKLFKEYSVQRRFAINKIFWSESNKIWLDYNIKKNSFQSENFYLSNLSPLWFGIKPPNDISEIDIINLHLKSSIENYNGVPYSFIYSFEQWDFPNVWAPYQMSLIEMLLKFDENLALTLGKKIFISIYTGWKMNNVFYEKYNGLNPGERGTGGEYEVQSGFGWTNGVVLRLIEIFKDDLLD